MRGVEIECTIGNQHVVYILYLMDFGLLGLSGLGGRGKGALEFLRLLNT